MALRPSLNNTLGRTCTSRPYPAIPLMRAAAGFTFRARKLPLRET